VPALALTRPTTMPRKKQPEPFHATLKRMMAERGYTIAQLARETGMAPQALGNIVRGNTDDIRLSTLTAILAAMGASLAEFEENRR
jgi:DNA-binding Xre family transcriptional regulator